MTQQQLKDFDSWNERKKEIHFNRKNMTFKERDIIWCHLGVNIGDEQDGKGTEKNRPVIVIKKLSKNLCIIIPLTTKIKDKHYYHKFEFKGKSQCAIITQIRLIDAKRLTHYMGQLPNKDFNLIKKKVIDTLS